MGEVMQQELVWYVEHVGSAKAIIEGLLDADKPPADSLWAPQAQEWLERVTRHLEALVASTRRPS